MKLIVPLMILFLGHPLYAAKEPAKLGMCIACHGKDGKGTNPMYPNLNGQKKGYMVKQLKAFKSGERKDPNMKAMTAALSEKDMEELAAYYSSQK